MLRVLLAVALMAGVLTAAPASADAGCPPGGVVLPPGTVQRQVDDLDGDGLPDALWIGTVRGSDGATNRFVGVSTASGAHTDVQIMSASPIPLAALAIDAENNGQHQIIVSDHRGAYPYVFAGCEIRTVVDNEGAPFVFDLQNRRDRGTGVGCSDLGDGRHLVGLQALPDGDRWTVHRTAVDLNGTLASIGRSDTVTATSAQDPVVTSAQTITCGDLTIDQDGVQQP